MIKIAGVVVLYNPSVSFIENIKSYVNQVDILFAVDNSEYPNQEFNTLLNELKNVIYISNGQNLGIAKALNVGAKLALEQHCDFLLMMDQDSIVSDVLVSTFKKFIIGNLENIGIIYPYHSYTNYDLPKETNETEEILTADTSGSLLNLSVYQKVGGFMDKLFIDYVDFEYCLRLRSNGYKIVQLNNVVLSQKLGKMISKKILFWKIGVSNHPSERVYYRVRNRLFVSAKYFTEFPLWSLRQTLYTLIELFKIVFYEIEKIRKIEMFFLGILHFILNKYGSLNQK